MGDSVRLSMKSVDSNVRKRLKDKRGKTLVVNFTPEIYTIAEIYPAKQNGTRREGYSVMDHNDNLIQYGQNVKIFFASDLQRAYEDELEPTIAHIYRAKQLNQTLPYEQY